MDSGTISMTKNEIMTLKKCGKDDMLVCLSGLVWITCRGCPADLVLAAGKSTALAGHRDICIQALSGSEIRMEKIRAQASRVTPHLDAAIA